MSLLYYIMNVVPSHQLQAGIPTSPSSSMSWICPVSENWTTAPIGTSNSPPAVLSSHTWSPCSEGRSQGTVKWACRQEIGRKPSFRGPLQTTACSSETRNLPSAKALSTGKQYWYTGFRCRSSQPTPYSKRPAVLMIASLCLFVQESSLVICLQVSVKVSSYKTCTGEIRIMHLTCCMQCVVSLQQTVGRTSASWAATLYNETIFIDDDSFFRFCGLCE